jgi:MFS superfamily sulfate permease-like transporter
MREIFIERPVEFWVATATAGIVVFVGVEQGIIAAIILSLFVHTRHGYRPSNTLLAEDKHGSHQSVPVESCAQFFPGLIIYRFNHSMYYANADLFKAEVLRLTREAQPPLTWLCVDGAAMDDVDFTAAAAIREVYELLRQRSIRLVFAEIQGHVRAELDRSKITDLVGAEYVFSTIYELADAYKKSSANTLRSPSK